ncbi:peptidase family C54-domain-containing protein [Infundibulicybe gibba]|nr:peptidase family C54-domain-containing protein [Infundibulicybe gibba]
MASKHTRHTPSPTSPPTHHVSKLPKFLQKQSNRDRSKSMTDPTAGASTSSIASISSSSTSPEIPPTPSSSKHRKSSKFLGMKDREEKSRRSVDIPPEVPSANTSSEMEEPPIIVEPVPIPRPRTRSERPLSTASDMPPSHTTLYASTSSTSRIGDLPTRLSGWFSHTFSTSTTDLSLPALLSQSQSSSPKGKGASALLTAAKHGKGHLDKAVRYLLDSDSTPDKCTDPIWLLGVQHTGYEPPPPTPIPSIASPRRASGSPPSSVDLETTQSSANWPPVFYNDFISRVWLTYRSQFIPIRDTRLADLPDNPNEVVASPTTVRTRPWNWGAEKTWSSDSGWGCMLRTGQSLLANALIHVHLGRDWRRPPYAVHTADYATYVQIVTWFFDTPSPEAPFSVHRMALAGKELGTDVGQWFGPSIAAGAIKTLVNSFPDAGLGVSVAADGTLYQSDVYAVSNSNHSRSPRRYARTAWGDRPVLLLLGIRLGIDGVNPIYYETIKLLYTFPQSVGIAGGRPGSSYYFVGSQADNLFYLDPHHARPAVPLKPAPPYPASYRETTPESDTASRSRHPRVSNDRAPTSPSSIRTGSSTFSYHAPLSPSPLQQQFSTSSTDSSSGYPHSRSPPPSQSGRWHHPASQPDSPGISSSDMDHRELFSTSGGGRRGLDPVQEHYVTAYNAADLKTFHCDRVRKMPLSGLDPSMLIGFLCRSEAEWVDFRRRVGDLPRTIFSIQDEPPNWPSDSDDNMGLESICDPDEIDMDMDEEGEGDGEQFFDTCSGSGSTSSASASHGGGDARSKSEEIDTEEDSVDPITPGPGSRFEILQKDAGKGQESTGGGDDSFEDGDIEDDWIDPSMPTPTPTSAEGPAPPSPVADAEEAAPAPPPKTKSARKGKKKSQVPVRVPSVKMPPPLVMPPSQEHYPFPITQRAPDEAGRGVAPGKRMHNARARDGGRTQSGGVRGVLTEE